MKWTIEKSQISDSIHHYKYLDADKRALTFADVVRLWATNSKDGKSFRTLTTGTIGNSPFRSFKWETPVVDSVRIGREFEFVILNSSGLERQENVSPFLGKFKEAEPDAHAIVFENLGRSAILVVPTPSKSTGVNHCHLGSFLRTADEDQTDQLWQMVGTAMNSRISKKPVWLSTAGGGVAWLHVRLDDQPKYYGYSPFKSA